MPEGREVLKLAKNCRNKTFGTCPNVLQTPHCNSCKTKPTDFGRSGEKASYVLRACVWVLIISQGLDVPYKHNVYPDTQSLSVIQN